MLNLKQSQLLLETLRGMCDASGDLVMETNPFKGGGVLTLNIVSCRAVTASTIVTIEIVKEPMEAGLRTLTMTNANSWYRTPGPIKVPSDWSVRVTFSDGGNVKLCEATVYGYVVYPE